MKKEEEERNLISPINEYEKKTHRMDFCLNFHMNTIVGHQFLKLTMNRNNFPEIGYSAIHEQQ